MTYWDYYNHYTPSKPREVRNGIKLQSKKIGSTWWSRRWISLLDSFGWSNRLQRGRNYARRGQVVNFRIKPGTVTAKVQGSASRPYTVTIELDTFSDKEWENALSEMGSQAMFIAKLLDGEIPDNIEEAFSRAKISLFPTDRRKIKTHCSCPDSANPCKHIAAVHYILAEEFDRDPFMIFNLRGRAKEQIITELRKIRGGNSENKKKIPPGDLEKPDPQISLEKCPDNFWSIGEEFRKFSVSITPPNISTAILKRLGEPPFWQEKDFWLEMERIYKVISDSAIKTAFDPSESDENHITSDIVLHGTWVFGDNNGCRFLLWGESELKNSKPGYSQKRRSKKIHKIPAHPFCASENRIMDVLRSADLSLNLCSPEELIAILPTSKNIPEASSMPFEKKGKKLSKWRVPCIGFPAHQALIWLALLPANGSKSIGNDISFWSLAAKFGIELIARQRFIPSVKRSGDRLYGIWYPVFNHADDNKRIALLTEAMPPVCGALKDNKSPSTDPLFSPRELIIDFLNAAIDETIRIWFRDKLESTPSWENRIIGRENLASIWLEGLSSLNGRIKGTTHQIKTLESCVNTWTRSIQAEGKEPPFRTCFRLEETEEEEHERKNKWHLSFHLQATDDQSLLIPAGSIWNSKSTVEYLNHKFEHPQERLLEDLAKASKLFHPLEKSLKSAKPDGCYINTEMAYEFLKEGAWLLEESGYGILIPSWWNRGGTTAGIGIHLTAKSPRKDQYPGEKFFGLNEIIEFDWKIAVGDELLSKEELEKLSRLKVPLVRVRGRWVEFKKDKIDDALKFLNKLEKDDMTLSQALKIGFGAEDTGIPIMSFDGKGWLNNLIGGDTRLRKIKTPEDFNGSLRDYQMWGFSWLSFLRDRGIGACLADDMGLGKTIQVISLLLHDKNNKKVKNPVLLVVPTSVVGNWQRELARFAPSLRVMVHHGTSRYDSRKFIKEAKKHDVVITTYALTVRDKQDLCKVNWEGLILDEAQNIKNPYTKQAQAIRGVNSCYRIALTGTPIENRLGELWSIMEFLNPGYLGSLKEFRKDFALPIERYKSREISEKFRNMIKPFILRRLKTDTKIIKDLPEKLEMKVYCNLTREQTTLYKAVVDDMMGMIEDSEGIQRRGLVLSTLTKLKQICDHPALFLHDESSLENRSRKLDRLKEMMEEVLSSDERALVFTQYTEMGEMLKNYLQQAFGYEPLFLHGGVTQKKRDKMITDFQEDKNAPPIFILSVKAGGFGLNLTRANHVFHFDRWWNPAVENQATDRAFRIGQRKNVQVHKFVCTGTVEEKIDDMIETKKGLSEEILSAGEMGLTELSNDKLREILSLRNEGY